MKKFFAPLVKSIHTRDTFPNAFSGAFHLKQDVNVHVNNYYMVVTVTVAYGSIHTGTRWKEYGFRVKIYILYHPCPT